MKIIAILEDAAASGGGYHQGLNAIAQMREVCAAGGFDFEALTTHDANLPALAALGVPAAAFAFTARDKLVGYLAATPWWLGIQVRLRLTAPFEAMLLARGCDLAYFVTPSARPNILQRLNYIVTVWDLCHRDTPEFPEVRDFGRFHLREALYRSVLPPAYAVVTDSAALSAALAHRYGVDQERTIAMPFAPAPALAASTPGNAAPVLEKYGLAPGYFFYPAQFWAHKNHARIVQALRRLRDAGYAPTVAFAGGDAGNRGHVERLIQAAELGKQVHLLGFVPAEDMRALYDGCRAVVMPTYFGPTNIPPLEAWLTGKPLIYSAPLASQAADAALYVDPDDPAALARAMRALSDDTTCATLSTAGAERLRQIGAERKRAEAELLACLQRFETRRANWP